MHKVDTNWMNNNFCSEEKVKLDLFRRFGWIAAAGDRHLAEFTEGKWYLQSPECANSWHFALTPVSWRKQDLKERLEKSAKLISGEIKPEIKHTGELGVKQMAALIGLGDLITNVNIPNYGQIPNLPIGAIVETNAAFRSDSLTPMFAGNIPESIYSMVSRICGEQETLYNAISSRDLERIFAVFANDPLVTCSIEDARSLFIEMCGNTEKYLGMYDLKSFK